MTERPTTGGHPPMRRADAEQNRARILDAARAAFEESEDASMHTIARLAGVGQGTLYRHFPTREALVLAVHRRRVQTLIDAPAQLAATHPPLVALRRWLDILAACGQNFAGLGQALLASSAAQLCAEGYQPVVDASDLMLRTGQAAGQIRADVDAEDLLLLVSFLWRADRGDEDAARSSHLLDIVVDAVRSGPQVSPTGPTTLHRDRP
ncbi:transcriptional regulator, TetR family [Parafrankia sp. EAN1pec]|uniref:TetR/AcrR family transcriptional regulator n=1 Tax=Parafrankia sp. (strain EAN1pec) TaxID=298653 RepID=UPI00015D9DC2|nr:transcriptional regulator, TetR family [Frankia sp. EAN1pec]